MTDFIPENSPSKKKPIDSVNVLNDTLRNLIGDYMHKLYFYSFEQEDEDRMKNGLTKRAKEADRRHQMAHDYSMRDLFLWSILTNRVDMAKVILSYMKYRICPALIATKVFKQYHYRAADGELRDGYEQSAKYFEQYAVDCLDKCDDCDASKACEIVLQRNELYGYVTCLQVISMAMILEE